MNTSTATSRAGCSWAVGNVSLSALGITASDLAQGLPPEAVAYLVEQERRRLLAVAGTNDRERPLSRHPWPDSTEEMRVVGSLAGGTRD